MYKDWGETAEQMLSFFWLKIMKEEDKMSSEIEIAVLKTKLEAAQKEIDNLAKRQDVFDEKIEDIKTMIKLQDKEIDKKFNDQNEKINNKLESFNEKIDLKLEKFTTDITKIIVDSITPINDNMKEMKIEVEEFKKEKQQKTGMVKMAMIVKSAIGAVIGAVGYLLGKI